MSAILTFRLTKPFRSFYPHAQLATTTIPYLFWTHADRPDATTSRWTQHTMGLETTVEIWTRVKGTLDGTWELQTTRNVHVQALQTLGLDVVDEVGRTRVTLRETHASSTT
jgi:hypothetical protein